MNLKDLYGDISDNIIITTLREYKPHVIRQMSYQSSFNTEILECYKETPAVSTVTMREGGEVNIYLFDF